MKFSEVFIFKIPELKLDMNPYIREHQRYFQRRSMERALAKFKTMIYNEYGHKCPECKQTLYNGERIELHHLKAVRHGGKYSKENIQPLHQICHQKATQRTRD